MKELVLWILEKLIGKDLLHYKVNVQSGLLVVLIGVAVYGGIQVHGFYWKWTTINSKVDSVPQEISNAVSQVDVRIDQDQRTLLSQLKSMQADAKVRDRKIDKIDDYIEYKEGVQLQRDTITNTSLDTIASRGVGSSNTVNQ